MFGSELAWGENSTKGKLYYRWLGHDHWGLRTRSMHVRRMVRQLRMQPTRILDAGSGEGVYALWFARHFPTTQVVGVELDPEQVSNSNHIARRLLLSNLNFIQADLVTYCSPEPFDLIVCVDVLEHIEDDCRALNSLGSALAEDGVLLIHVPHIPVPTLWPFAGFQRPNPTHVRDGYGQKELEDKLMDVELQPVECRYTFGWFGATARELAYRINELGKWRPMIKLALFPVLLGMAYMDLQGANVRHQGLLVRAMRQKGGL